jgi:hypothetical protein
MQNLNTHCFTIIGGKPAGENVGIITANEAGYHLTNYDWSVGDKAEAICRATNEARGIDAKTQMEFECKSMFVWSKK